MSKNIFSFQQQGGITADKVLLTGSEINNQKDLGVAEGRWTKLGVIVGIISLLFAVLEFLVKGKI